MAEALLAIWKETVPDKTLDELSQDFQRIDSGDYGLILRSDFAQSLLASQLTTDQSWQDNLHSQIKHLCPDHSTSASSSHHKLLIVAYVALLAFLQATVTGPILSFDVAKILFPTKQGSDDTDITRNETQLLASLSIDGIAAHKNVSNAALLCLAKAILTTVTTPASSTIAHWLRARASFVHQRLLSEISPTLQSQIFADLDEVQHMLDTRQSADEKAQFSLERATIETYYGLDKQARQRLDQAAQEQQFTFALTGALGKRTKFQQHDLSQLVVLAKSHTADTSAQSRHVASIQPQSINLDDDTILEKISFNNPTPTSTDIKSTEDVPALLKELDPANQPRLSPLDSIILLALASSITNTSPADGLTREETVPYAVRVLDGGSSNWQIYTQALLVRSRVEGFKSRTVERGLLQLQALVDQVIADTTGADKDDGATNEAATFLPRPTKSESASASERLRYIFQLASPNRWDLEIELAQRWVSLGGLRSALEIYERLGMWAEVALCLAATEREDKARKIIRRQLYHATDGQKDEFADESEQWNGPLRNPLPADAPRLYCILGDIDQSIDMYEMAWQVSGCRYARAQRSLGKLYFGAADYAMAASSYKQSLKMNTLDRTSWFAMGCANLNLSDYDDAVDAFTRCVQLDDTDAESWTNLAAALLKQDPSPSPAPHTTDADEDEEKKGDEQVHSDARQRQKRDALKALQRAAVLKHDSFRIWENVMIVSASLSPPDLPTVVTAQSNIIRLRGSTAGESCIDADIMTLVVRHVVDSEAAYDPSRPGFGRLVVELFDKQIQGLITHSRALWNLVSKLAQWRKRYASALEGYEKAWRACTQQPSWESSDHEKFQEVVEATLDLCDAYESFGPMETSEGLAANTGVLVAKDWKFRSKSALSNVLGRARDAWQDSEGYTRLQDALEQLKSS